VDKTMKKILFLLRLLYLRLFYKKVAGRVWIKKSWHLVEEEKE
tara:strand:+ start:2172 stop:2300 length:129 start_codon:yes stop_codon:yes gene_type:complete